MQILTRLKKEGRRFFLPYTYLYKIVYILSSTNRITGSGHIGEMLFNLRIEIETGT